MKSPFLIIFFIIIYFNSFGQNSSNYLSVIVLNPPNFNLNTTSLLENDQVLSSAIQIQIGTGSNATVYVSVPSGISTTTSTPMPTSNLLLNFNNTDDPSQYQGSYSTNDIALTTSNQVLFHKLAHNGYYSNWYYDVKIPAIGYTYKPGTYSYNIKFTMTQP